MESLDTNILLYAINKDCPEHKTCADLVQHALGEPESWISYAKAEERQRIRAALKTLSENERQVIIHRFGLAGAPLTLLQTGRILRMSYENVRLIEKRALPKLRTALNE